MSVTTPRRGVSLPADRKQHILDNFDLEVAHKTRRFESNHSNLLESFSRRVETEVMRVPKELRGLKMRDLNAQWGGSWGITLGRIKDAAALKQGRGAQEEVQEQVEEMKKRKRAGGKGARDEEPEAGPSKQRTIRAPAQKPVSTKRSSALASTPLRRTTRNRAASIAPTSPTVRANASTSMSQAADFPTSSFQPQLPTATPRLPRPDEPLRSANGSPLANPYSSDAEAASVPSSDDELEDAAELEANMLAEMAAKKSMRAPAPSRGKPPRASFIRIRPSVSGTSVRPPLGSMATPKAAAALKADASNTTASPAAANAANLMRIALPDGGTLEFDPLTIEDPLALEEEMRAKGLDEAQISGVRNAINQRIQAMMAQFSRWKL